MILQPTGSPISHTKEQQEDLAHLRERFTFKDQIKNSRVLQLREQADFMQNMLPYYQQFNSFDPRSRNLMSPQLYKSATLHVTWNILSFGSTKLAPDFVEFTPERTQRRPIAMTEAENLGYTVNLARKKGGYIKAIKSAQRDNVRGEAYLYQDYGLDPDGSTTGINFHHLAFSDVWHEYGETDVIVVKNLSVLGFVETFGEELLKKVTFGQLVGGAFTDQNGVDFTDRRNAKPFEQQRTRIQVVYYIDRATRTFQVWLGGNAFLWKSLKGDKFPFLRDDGTAFQPVKRRTFYPETPGDSYFGYGPLDLLIPLARLENNIVNSTAIRAIKAASRPVIMSSNDPEDASIKYDQFLSEAGSASNTKPFFVQDSATGTTMKPFVVDEGVDNANMTTWMNFFLDQATIRTRLNFRSFTELAPTGIQDELRIQLEETANKIVLKSNADVDADFATETVYLLKKGDSKFHNLKVWLTQSEEELVSTGEDAEAVELIKDENGQLPPKEMTVRSFLKTIKDPQYDVTSRVDGVFDNKTAVEIRAMEKAMALFGAFPQVIAKIGKKHLDEIIPSAEIQEKDFLGTPELQGQPQGAPQSPVPTEQQINQLLK